MSCAQAEADLDLYPKSWQLNALGPSSRKNNHLLVPVNSAFGPAMLKRSIKGRPLSTSSSLLQWYKGCGSANILKKRHDTQLLELIDGPALCDLAAGENIDQATDILGEVIKKLHTPKSSRLKARLTPLSTLMHPLLEQRHSSNLVHRHAARLIHHLLDSSRQQRPLHGNLHFSKILHHSKRGWLTIAPRGIWGDPHFEPVMALCHSAKNLSDARRQRLQLRATATRLSDILALNRDRLLTFAFCLACLKHLHAEHQGTNARHWHDMSIILLDSLVE